jgi:hypothetical protein
MRLLKSMLVVAALGLAAPVWADGGHGRGRGHDGFHHDRHGHRHHSHWKHHRHHGHGWRGHDPYYYSGYYYAPYPRYAYAAPAPGVHIVVPNIYIPLR